MRQFYNLIRRCFKVLVYIQHSFSIFNLSVVFEMEVEMEIEMKVKMELEMDAPILQPN